MTFFFNKTVSLKKCIERRENFFIMLIHDRLDGRMVNVRASCVVG